MRIIPASAETRKANLRQGTERWLQHCLYRDVITKFPRIKVDAKRIVMPYTLETGNAIWSSLGIKGYKLDEKRQRFLQFWQCLLMAAQRSECCVQYSRRNGSSTLTTDKQIVEALHQSGWVVEVRSKPGGNKMSRLLPSLKLHTFVDTDPWKLVPPPEPHHCVKLTTEDGSEVPIDVYEFPKHHIARVTLRKLSQINQTNAEFRITYRRINEYTQRWESRLTQLRPFYVRDFKDDFQSHGRMYMKGSETLRKTERPTIEFNDDPSIELDYSGMHARMLYHLAGIDYRDDPYLFLGTTQAERYVAKQITNTAFNTASPKKCLQSMRNQQSFYKNSRLKSTKDRDKAQKLLSAMEKVRELHGPDFTYAEAQKRMWEAHPALQPHFYTGTFGRLAIIESNIALNVMYDFAKEGIPILGVHDSFVVPRIFIGKLKMEMIQAYHKHLHFPPLISTH